MSTNPVPDGYHTLTPYYTVDDPAALIAFLANAFGAVEVHRTALPDGSVMHAALRIGNSMVMLGGASEEWKARTNFMHMYVPDIDAVYAQAIAAGATSVREPNDEFYGDRSAGVTDPAGNLWWIATHIEDVSEDEIARRMAEAKKG